MLILKSFGVAPELCNFGHFGSQDPVCGGEDRSRARGSWWQAYLAYGEQGDARHATGESLSQKSKERQTVPAALQNSRKSPAKKIANIVEGVKTNPAYIAMNSVACASGVS